ncbi:MAG: hypothetical protein PHW10_03525 [Candidatus Peribacteraceae bacterium]|nr:hypothetical protein [Candidatus Peribacteraceae bacterium]
MKFLITPEANRVLVDRCHTFEDHIGNLAEQLAQEKPVAGEQVVRDVHMVEAMEKLAGEIEHFRSCVRGDLPEIGDIPHYPLTPKAFNALTKVIGDYVYNKLGSLAALLAQGEEVTKGENVKEPGEQGPQVHVPHIEALLENLEKCENVPEVIRTILLESRELLQGNQTIENQK